MEESLLTAARRVVRFFNIDAMHGGLISEQTQIAIDTLDRQVRIETEKQRRAEEAKNDGR